MNNNIGDHCKEITDYDCICLSKHYVPWSLSLVDKNTKCRSIEHKCICVFDHKNCLLDKKHDCICDYYHTTSNFCKAVLHDCQCIGIEPGNKCISLKHRCRCWIVFGWTIRKNNCLHHI